MLLEEIVRQEVESQLREHYKRIEEIIEDEDYASRPLVSTQLAEVKRAIGQSSEALAILSSVVDGQFEPPVRTLVQYGSLLKLVGRKHK